MTKLTDMIARRRERLALDTYSIPNADDIGAELPHSAQVIDIASHIDIIDANARVISISSIEVRAQARKTFHLLEELAADIQLHSQLQPVVVREIGEGQYVLVSGERRLRAIRDVLRHPTIAARVIHCASDEQTWRRPSPNVICCPPYLHPVCRAQSQGNRQG